MKIASFPGFNAENSENIANDLSSEALLKAKKNVDRSREQMMDRHNEIIAEAMKKLTQWLEKKKLEKDIQKIENERDMLNEEALLERLNHRSLLTSEKTI